MDDDPAGLNAWDNASRLETYIAKTARSPILFNNRIQSLCLSALIISALFHFIDFVQRSLEALAASFLIWRPRRDLNPRLRRERVRS